SNHIHLIVSAKEPNKLSDILRDFKKFTSSEILKAIAENNKESRKNWMLWIFKRAGENNNRNKDWQFWQQDNHPVQCDTDKISESKLNYLHANPVRAGLVKHEKDYIYSSGIDYYGDGKGLIELCLL
ncbi:transposase, partial [Pseudoxanthomonas sp. SGD-10]